MNVLIIADLQNDFVEGGALAVPRGRDIVPLVNKIQERFGLVIATQDWHPDDHGSHVNNHPGATPGDVVELAGRPQVLWPAHCVQNTEGADFVPGLRRDQWATVFQKGAVRHIDSYSGFFDNGGEHATGLGDYLKEQQVTDVYVLGLATDSGSRTPLSRPQRHERRFPSHSRRLYSRQPMGDLRDHQRDSAESGAALHGFY